MARTTNKDQPQKTITVPIETVVDPVNGLYNTIIYEETGRKYAGQPLVSSFPLTNFEANFTTATPNTYRTTGAGMWTLDSNKTVMVVKSGTMIYIYEYSTTLNTSPTLVSSFSCLTANKEIYLETIYGSTEKASITGYTKYVFLSLPGEAWVVAYNTRIGNWQVEKVNNTYSGWTSSFYNLGDRRIPSVDNGYYYEVTVAGSSAGTEPTWPTTIGNTVVNGGVTWICRGRYNGFPTTTSSSVVILDGYIFVCVGGDIYNSDLDLPDSWTTTNFISTETNPDNLVALAKYKNYIVAFGTNTIEFFYDAANTTGSPLARQEGVQHNIGCIGQGAVTTLEDRVFWIAQTGSTYYSIWELDNFKTKKLSSSEFDNVLTNLITTSVSSYPEISQYQLLLCVRIGGKFIIGVPTINKSLPTDDISFSYCFFLDLETNLISKFLISDSKNFARPFNWNSLYLWPTWRFGYPSTYYVCFTSLTVQTYDQSPGGGGMNISSIFDSTCTVKTKRLNFDLNNFKVLNEIQLNVFPGISIPSTNYWNIYKDRETAATNLIPTSGYRTTRCGRAREFVCEFIATSYPICDITFKYTEHNK